MKQPREANDGRKRRQLGGYIELRRAIGWLERTRVQTTRRVQSRGHERNDTNNVAIVGKLMYAAPFEHTEEAWSCPRKEM